MTTFIYPTVQTTISGGATEAKQDVIITELQDINTELDGQTTQLTTLLAIDFATETTLATLATEATLSTLNGKVTAVDTGNVTVASSALPTGAATETTLATLATETTLSTLNGKVTAVDTGNVTVSSSALPTGAATETTLSTLNGKVTAVDTGNVTVTSSALPTGAATETTLATLATETTLSTLNGKVTAVDTGNVTIASSALPTGAATETTVAAIQTAIEAIESRDVTEFVRNDYSSTNVTTAAYVELIASTTSDISEMQIFDSSGQTLVIATGAAASEVDKFLVFPGGNGDVKVQIAAGTRISIKAISATASVGEIAINLIG